MKLIRRVPKLTEEKESKFISICNRGEFLVKSREIKQSLVLVVNEEVSPTVEIPKKLKLLLE